MEKIAFLILCVSLFIGCERNSNDQRVVRSFDENWLFHRGDVSGGEKAALQDTGWRKIDVPHDWSIEDVSGTCSPFDSTVVNGVSSGFTVGGTGWYRKYFNIPETDAGKRVFIQFDGVYMNSDIWVNEKHVGNHFYGYTSFWYDITDFLKFGEENLIAVKVDRETVTSRWYSGSGIYRHVWLSLTNPLYIENWGNAITTPEVSADKATVAVTSTIVNQYPENKSAKIIYKIKDRENGIVAESEASFEIESGKKETLKQTIPVANPQLWSAKSPYLYTLEIEILTGKQVIDRTKESFGIRSIQFDAQNGFRLNGKALELKGGCIHHDNGPLGSVALDRAEERKVELHKAAGFNALRMAHNPPSPAILAACDRLGILVIDEAFDVWRSGHFTNDYASCFNELWPQDLASMVLRDRNHPSIIMWSIGNEIRNTETPEIAEVCKNLSDYVRSIDSTRPVTAAVNAIIDEKDPYFSSLDVCGYNYSPERYQLDHQRHPNRIMFATESYAIEAYDYWKAVEEYPWVIGDFVWTSFDHIGEASIGWRGYPQEMNFYPWNLAYCGDMDICGNRRPQSYYRQTLWDEQPSVSLFVTSPVPSFPFNPKKASWSVWDWPDVVSSWNFERYEEKPLDVVAYSSCEELELFLNGVSLGKKKNRPENKNMIHWEVPYQAGELKVVGLNVDKEVSTSVLKTAGKPVKLQLTADRQSIKPDGNDLSYIKVELVDENGIKNPIANNLVKFELSGAGKLAAVASSNPTSVESFQQARRHAWRGECMAIVRSGKEKGEIYLTAKAEGLPDETITIKVE
ncbi:MAG: DUF4982 domain-containing protein [Dysgonamonadaceae bacterium]|jgi:beta-galactosidase|nr:DUF4982 domain-containing protein [Dysgonamonadaceae bacterium]